MKKLLALMVCGAMGLSAVACGQTEDTDSIESSTESTATETSEAEATTTGNVDNSFAEDTDALVEAYADAFEQVVMIP